MKTATAEKKADSIIKVVKVGNFKIEDITTNGNFRTVFDAGLMRELADNIKTVGVLQPILLRPEGEKMILVAGGRRLRAAKMAGLKEIPARVIDVDAKGADEIQALENLHRADLNPIEEAKAFQTLLENGNYEVKSLAERIDKSEAYVYRAIRLLDLCKEAKDAISAGRMHVSAGHQLLRAPVTAQREITKGILSGHYGTISSVMDAIGQKVGRELSAATFPKDIAYAGEVNCTACTYNSGNQGMLFDGAKKGQCTNGPCFDKKQSLALKEKSDAEASKLGVKNMGEKKQDYSGNIEGMKGAIVLTEGVDQKIIKANPEAFAVAVTKGQYYNDRQKVSLVCLDPKVLPGQGRESNPQGNHMAKERAKKKREGIIRMAMMKELVGMLPERLNEKMLVCIVGNLDSSYKCRQIWDAFGIPKKGSSAVEPKEYEGKSLKDLSRLVFMLAADDFTDYGGKIKKAYTDIGIKIAEMRARAMKTIAASEQAKKAEKKK
jgi:ParB/RepB/Spo0J family partition protein